DGKQKGGSERPEIVERQDVRHDVAKVIAATDDAHQERDLKSHKDSNHDYKGVHQKLKSLGVCECKKQQCRRESSNHAEKQFDPDKAVGKTAINVAGEGAPNSHREEVTANDRRKLKHAVAEQVAGERSRNELVNEPTGSNQQDRD